MQFCETVGLRSITEFNYRIADRKEAHIFVGVITSYSIQYTKLYEVPRRPCCPAPT